MKWTVVQPRPRVLQVQQCLHLLTFAGLIDEVLQLRLAELTLSPFCWSLCALHH